MISPDRYDRFMSSVYCSVRGDDLSQSNITNAQNLRLCLPSFAVFVFMALFCRTGVAVEPETKMTVLWMDAPDGCGSESTFKNVVAEVDDLNVQFRQSIVEHPAAVNREDTIRAMLETQQADVAIWITCEDGEIHLYAELLETPLQTKFAGQKDAGAPPTVEAVTAIVRNWLEGILPLWKAERTRTQRTEDKPSEEDASPDSDSDNYLLPGTASSDHIKFVDATADSPDLISIAVGLDATTPGEGRLVPGGYLTAMVRPFSHIGFGVSASIQKPIEFEAHAVSVTLRQYPLRGIVSGIFQVTDVEMSGHVAFELTPVQRRVQVADDSPRTIWKWQPAVVAMGGIAFRMTARFSWFLNLGARFLLRETILQIRVSGQLQTIHNPWKVQPMLLTGLQLKLF